MGFDSLLVWDHYMLPGGNGMFEAWSLLAYLAAKIDKLKLGTCVTPIPFRPPAMLAKIVATVDVLSGGRVILGIGAGWHRPEFEAYSQWDEAPVRVAKTREGLDLILKLWSEEGVNFKGRHYSARYASLEPKPVQKPHPQLWFGTRGDHMMNLAARYGDGWIPVNIPPSRYEDGVKRISLLRSRLSKRNKFVYALAASDSSTNARSFMTSIESYAEAGCEYYCVTWSYPTDSFIDRIRWFAREVASSFV